MRRRNLSQDLHQTRWCPMMLLSFKFRLIYCCLSTACASGRERWRERLWVWVKKWGARELGLLLEVNNEVSAEAVSQSVKTVTDFHLRGISERHLKESQAENADKHKGVYTRRPLCILSHVCVSKHSVSAAQKDSDAKMWGAKWAEMSWGGWMPFFYRYFHNERTR